MYEVEGVAAHVVVDHALRRASGGFGVLNPNYILV